MRCRRSYTLAVILLCLSTYALAQNWSGIIDPSRAIDWSQAGISGGIPTRTTICSTLNPGATSAQINAAIASCPANEVVYLNAGTYTIASGITFNGHSNVTLRGAGPTQTILQFTGGDTCGGQGGDICAINSTGYYVGSAPVQPGGSNAASWTAGYSQGTTQITLSKTSGLSVGSVIILDQANDTSDTGGVFICDTSACHQSGETGSSNGRTIGGIDYNQTQMVSVTAISGSTVTISPGIYANNWRSSQSPGAWWTGAQISSVGIENMTVDNSLSTSAAAGIYFYDCYQCWVTNVKSLNGNRNHVWLYQSAHAVIQNNYFYGTQNGAEESYGVEGFITSDDLIENNIFDHIASPGMSSGSSGVVWGYNFSINNYYNVSPAWMQNTYSSHDAGDEMNLWEGNEFNAIDCDDIHGSTSVNTYFRNQLTGTQTGKTLNTHAMNLYSYCRGYNVIGNVLGTIGYDTQYQVSPTVGLTVLCDTSVYILGFPNSECGGGTNPSLDSLVSSTLMRWGNYDTVNAAAQWNASEVPTTAVKYINGNPVPANHNLPNSFYLSSSPSWWGAMAWPPIGPDVTGGSDPTGHVYANPAQTCYNAGTFTNGVLNFDATNCYTGSSAPTPPTNLSAVVQ
jgi:hypothetical protein